MIPFRPFVLGASALLPAGIGHAETVRVLDHLIMHEQRFAGEKIGEFSALVAASDGKGVIAVSDRGYVARLDVRLVGKDLSTVNVVSVHVLTGPDGRDVRDGDFSPEAVALLPDGALAIVDESSAALSVFDTEGLWLRHDQLPEGLRDIAQQASERDGVEALAWTAATGFVAVPEEPQQGFARNVHTLRTTLAGDWAMVLDGTDAVSVKGLEAADGRIYLLERTRDSRTDGLTPFLRILDPQACMAASACVGTTHPVGIEGLTNADFEGIAALGGGRFLLVSDDKIDGDLRSVFALVQVE